jgi:hypothetical protein
VINAKMVISYNIKHYHPDIIVSDVWPIANHVKIKSVIPVIRCPTAANAHLMPNAQPVSLSNITCMQASALLVLPLTTTVSNVYQPINVSPALPSTTSTTTINAPHAVSSIQGAISATNSNGVLVV